MEQANKEKIYITFLDKITKDVKKHTREIQLFANNYELVADIDDVADLLTALEKLHEQILSLKLISPEVIVDLVRQEVNDAKE